MGSGRENAITLNELAKRVGKSAPYVLTLQKKFGLPACKDYPDGYAVLLKKLVYLLICAVPDKDIRVLLKLEKQLLELLKADSLHDGPLWFAGLCTMKSGPTRLLLSGFDLGHVVEGDAVQTGLDFSERDRELFEAADMGADALRQLQLYRDAVETVRKRIRKELPTLEAALKWGTALAKPEREEPAPLEQDQELQSA